MCSLEISSKEEWEGRKVGNSWSFSTPFWMSESLLEHKERSPSLFLNTTSWVGLFYFYQILITRKCLLIFIQNQNFHLWNLYSNSHHSFLHGPLKYSEVVIRLSLIISSPICYKIEFQAASPFDHFSFRVFCLSVHLKVWYPMPSRMVGTKWLFSTVELF